jgi:hypothetical protein
MPIIEPDAIIRADNYINNAERDVTPADDEGRVPKLEDDAKLHPNFVHPVKAVMFGENISKGESVFVSKGIPAIKTYNNGSGSDIYGPWTSGHSANDRNAQIFTVPSIADKFVTSQFQIYRTRGSGGSGGSNGGTFLFEIFAVDGANKPTGAALGTYTWNFSTWSEGDGAKTLTWASPVELTAGGKFALSIKFTANDTDENYLRGHSGMVSEHIASFSSTDGGATWSSESKNTIYFQLFGYWGTKGKAFKTSALISTTTVPDGFCAKDGTTGNIGYISELGNMIDKTVSDGSTYYVSDTAGAVSTSPGTISYEVGVGVGTTKLSTYRAPRVRGQIGYSANTPIPFDGIILHSVNLSETSETFNIRDTFAGGTVYSSTMECPGVPSTTASATYTHSIPVRQGQYGDRDGTLIPIT